MILIIVEILGTKEQVKERVSYTRFMKLHGVHDFITASFDQIPHYKKKYAVCKYRQF